MIFKRLGAFFLDILEIVVFATAIFLFVYLLILQPHKIKGASMEPNFPSGEFLLTDKLTYRIREPRRGDVIVFEAPGTNGEEFIKRIIALPDETIAIRDNVVLINNNPLKEDYLDSSVTTSALTFIKNGQEITIPANSYFVMGDNRPASSDSRIWGLVPKSKITGRAWIIYWPPQSAGVVKSPTYTLPGL